MDYNPTDLHRVEKIKDGELQPLARELASMDSRIRLCGFFGDIVDNAGYLLSKDRIVFPYMMPGLDHEIAHMVEMNNFSRLLQSDFGMKYDDKTQLEGMATSGLIAATSREIRVRAIQRIINPKVNPEPLVNFWWVEEIQKRLPFGRFNSIAQARDWAVDLREKTSNAWNEDRLRHEWTVRLDYIREWMESN